MVLRVLTIRDMAGTWAPNVPVQPGRHGVIGASAPRCDRRHGEIGEIGEIGVIGVIGEVSAVGVGLDGVELGVLAGAGHEFVVGTDLDHP